MRIDRHILEGVGTPPEGGMASESFPLSNPISILSGRRNGRSTETQFAKTDVDRRKLCFTMQPINEGAEAALGAAGPPPPATRSRKAEENITLAGGDEEMPEFLDPFSGMKPERKMTKAELTRALRLAMAAELEAVHLYEAQADATDDPLAKEVLIDIANEERVHAGEFQRLLNILLPDEEHFLQKGAAEVDEMAEEVSGGGAPAESDADAAAPGDDDVPSVGSMKE